MNQTELKSIETAMRKTPSKQLYTRYQVIYLHLQGYKNVEIAKMLPLTAQTIGKHIRNYKKTDWMDFFHSQSPDVLRNFLSNKKPYSSRQ